MRGDRTDVGGCGGRPPAESLRRRPFLRTLGTIGLAAAGAGRVGAEEAEGDDADDESEWPEIDDPYYRTLADDLEAMGLPPAEFVHGNTEAAVRDQYWADAGSYGTVEELDVGDDVPFSEATRFEITEKPPNEWDVQLRTAEWHSDPYRSVEENDVMLGVAYLRAPDGEGEIQYAADNSRSLQWNSVTDDAQQYLDAEWRRYYFPIWFEVAADGSAYEWSTQFHFGFGVQTIDIGGVALLDFGQDVMTTDLPSGRATSRDEGATDEETEGTDADDESDEDRDAVDDGDDERDAEDEPNEDAGDDGSADERDDGERPNEDRDAARDDSERNGGSSTGIDTVPGLGIVSGLAGLGAATGHLLSRAADSGENGGNEGT